MIRLLKIELHKILPYRAFWILLALYFVLLALVANGAVSFDFTFTNDGQASSSDLSMFGLYRFPEVWHHVAYIARWFRIFLAILVIILITNEFSYRTLRQNVISGMSRAETLWAKALMIGLLAMASTVFLFVLGLVLGLSHSPETSDLFGKIGFLGAHFIQVAVYLLLALLIGFLIKKAGFSIGLLLLYTFIIEPIIAYKLSDEVDRYLPLSALNQLVQNPFKDVVGLEAQVAISGLDVGVSLAYAALFTGVVWWLLMKKDL